jgi:hypothetical protein
VNQGAGRGSGCRQAAAPRGAPLALALPEGYVRASLLSSVGSLPGGEAAAVKW